MVERDIACTREWVLKIKTGLHSGASVPLTAGSVIVLGAAPDCDVVLMDDGVASRLLAMREVEGVSSVRVLDGEVEMNGQTLTALDWHIVPTHADLKLLGTNVILHVLAAGESVASDMTGEPATQHQKIVARLPGQMDGSQRTLRTWMRPWVFGTALTALAVATGLFWIVAPATSVPLTQPGLQKLMKDIPGATNLHVGATNGTFRIEGLADTATVQHLRQALAQRKWVVTLQTMPPSQLVHATEAAFRAEGINAISISHLGAGRLQLANVDPEDPAVRRVAEHVRQTVPLLTELRFAPYERPVPQRAPVTDPGKRLTAIIYGPVSYVATADGSRYEIGAELPDGHAVRGITEQGVQLERDGQRTWFNF